MDRHRTAPAALFCILVSACGGSDGDVPMFQVSDSAGVSIVENADSDVPEWVVSDVPVISIGSLEGHAGHDLAMPWSSLRLPDGRIVISNAQTHEVRFYSRDGDFIRSVGGRGSGPGEFQVVGRLSRGPGDSVAVVDPVLSRLTLFSSEGELGRTIPIDLFDGGFPSLRGFLSDMLVVYQVTRSDRSGGESRALRDEGVVVVKPMHLRGGEEVVGAFPAVERFNQVLRDGAVVWRIMPFTRNLHTAVAPGRVWIGQSDRYEVRGFGEQGRLELMVRLNRPLAPVTSEYRRRYFDHAIERAPSESERENLRAVQSIMTFPPALPAYSDILADTSGHLWVQEYALPWSGGSRVWRAYDPNGRAVSLVRMPMGLDVHEIGHDYVMGMWRDELGVEHIHVHTLVRDW
jgi:hypothetical protein